MISSLIISLVIIGLLAFILYAGVNYINIDVYTNAMQENKIPTDLYSYEMALKTYYTNFKYYPTEDNWIVELKSNNALLPKLNNQYYKYYNKNNKVAICAEKTINNIDELKVFQKIHDKGFTVLSYSCFSTTDENISIDKYPITIALTKWIN